MSSPNPRTGDTYTVTVIPLEGRADPFEVLYTETFDGDGADYFHSVAPLRALVRARILHRDLPDYAPVAILLSAAGLIHQRAVSLPPHNPSDDHLIPGVLAQHRPDNPGR